MNLFRTRNKIKHEVRNIAKHLFLRTSLYDPVGNSLTLFYVHKKTWDDFGDMQSLPELDRLIGSVTTNLPLTVETHTKIEGYIKPLFFKYFPEQKNASYPNLQFTFSLAKRNIKATRRRMWKIDNKAKAFLTSLRACFLNGNEIVSIHAIPSQVGEADPYQLAKDEVI